MLSPILLPPTALPATPPAARLRAAIVSDAAVERNGVGAYYRDLAEHLRTHPREARFVSAFGAQAPPGGRIHRR